MNIAMMQRFKQMERDVVYLKQEIETLLARIAALETPPKPRRTLKVVSA